MSALTEKRERTLQWVLAAVTVVGLFVLLVMSRQAHVAADDERAGTEAMRVARTSVPAILSYTDANLANQLASSRRLMTPDYAKRYAAMVKKRVWPLARKFAVANQVGVVSTGVVRSSKSSAVVLVFANQTTRTKAKPEGITQGTRLRVTLTHHGSKWLVDELRPL